MIAGRGRSRIRPPRRGLNGDEVDFDKTWLVIESAFHEIHNQNASRLSYEELYRNAYKIVLKKRGDDLYKHVYNFEKEELSNKVRKDLQKLLSPDLLSNSQAFGVTTSNERRVSGEKLLKGLKSAWSHHQVCMSMLADVLMYMDRVYCQDNRRPSIYVTAMILFRDEVLNSSTSDMDKRTVLGLLSNVVLEQIQMEREGDVIDKYLIKSCVHMLDGLHADDMDSDDRRLYNVFFEPEFIETSRKFYRAEAESLLGQYDAGTYCKHARRRISEEEDRCRSTLLDATAEKIQVVVEEEMISNRIAELVRMDTGVRYMLDNDRCEELEMIYELNARVDATKAEVTQAVQKRLVDMGFGINRDAVAASIAAPVTESGEKGRVQEKSINLQTVAAIKWVEDVLLLKDKFDRIWRLSFHSDNLLQTAITRSFADFINSPTFPRSSEYISLFIDENMKKGIKGKTDAEIDEVLEKAITLLRYVQDKDLFERYYKKHLCRRLLMNKSVSAEVEKQMISKMKVELGNNFTSKMEAMFKDMTISEELASGYKKHVDGLGDRDPERIELGLHVLTSMTWPMEMLHVLADYGEEKKKPVCNFPPAVEKIKRGFEKYYGQKHSGRNLTWLPNMGSADIKVVFPKVPQPDGSFKKKRHEINVSTYSMLILLLFNDLPEGEHLTCEEIQARTNIPPNDLTRNLQALAVAPKTRILLKEPMSKDVKMTDKFSFNEGFNSKFIKIKVGVVMGNNKVETDREREDTEHTMEERRKHMIEAAIVRVMKQRQQQSHQQLIIEVIAQLAGRFKPEVPRIKKVIETLIEREYMKRIEDAEVDSYEYIA